MAEVTRETIDLYKNIQTEAHRMPDGTLVTQFVGDRYWAMKESESRDRIERQWRDIERLRVSYNRDLEGGESYTRSVRFPILDDTITKYKQKIMRNFPRAIVEATNNDQAEDLKKAKVIEKTRDMINEQTYVKKNRMLVLDDMMMLGTGVEMHGYERVIKGDKVIYDDLTWEHVDPRYFFIDENALEFFDPTNKKGARDCIWLRKYPLTTWLDIVKGSPLLRNADAIQAFMDDDVLDELETEIETDEDRESVQYVNVAEYFNQELNMHAIVSNVRGRRVEHFVGKLPNHKRLPFVLRYFDKRKDSIYGVPLAEKLAPVIRAKELLFNLFFDAAKLSAQGVTIVDQKSDYNSEIHQIQPGAVWPLRTVDGNVNNSFAQLNFGGVPADYFNMANIIDDQMSITSGIDFRTPDRRELATDIRARLQDEAESVTAVVLQNMWQAEKEAAELQVSNIKEFIAPKKKSADGKKQRVRKIRIDGFIAQQENEGVPEFVPTPGVVDYFSVTVDNTDVDVAVSIIDPIEKSAMDEDEKGRLLQFFQIFVNTLSLGTPEALALTKDVDLKEFLVQVGEKVGIEMEKIFPQLSSESVSEIDAEHEALAAGEVVPLPEMESPEVSRQHLIQHLKFTQSKRFDEFSPASKRNMQEHISATAANSTKMQAPAMETAMPPQGGQIPQAPPQLGTPAAVPGVGGVAAPPA